MGTEQDLGDALRDGLEACLANRRGTTWGPLQDRANSFPEEIRRRFVGEALTESTLVRMQVAYEQQQQAELRQSPYRPVTKEEWDAVALQLFNLYPESIRAPYEGQPITRSVLAECRKAAEQNLADAQEVIRKVSRYV